jgi:hypothetical protein
VIGMTHAVILAPDLPADDRIEVEHISLVGLLGLDESSHEPIRVRLDRRLQGRCRMMSAPGPSRRNAMSACMSAIGG